jgi:hypothetical protein
MTGKRRGYEIEGAWQRRGGAFGGARAAVVRRADAESAARRGRRARRIQDGTGLATRTRGGGDVAKW